MSLVRGGALVIVLCGWGRARYVIDLLHKSGLRPLHKVDLGHRGDQYT